MTEGINPLSIIEILERRGAHLYHSCHLTRFGDYLIWDGLKSINDFNGNDPRIRLSFMDKAALFAKDSSYLPDPDGALTLQFEPRILKLAKKIELFLVPPQDPTDKNKQPITVDDVPYLFRYTEDAPMPEKAYIKLETDIGKAYGADGPLNPQLFLTLSDNLLPLSAVRDVVADNYLLKNRQLRDWTKIWAAYHGREVSVRRRYCPADIGGYLSDRLVIRLLEKVPNLAELSTDEEPLLANWAASFAKRDMEEAYLYFARRLREETLLPILERENEILKVADATRGGYLDRMGEITIFTRGLIDKLCKEGVSADAIARITETDQELIDLYLSKRVQL